MTAKNLLATRAVFTVVDGSLQDPLDTIYTLCAKIEPIRIWRSWAYEPTADEAQEAWDQLHESLFQRLKQEIDKKIIGIGSGLT